MVTSGLGFMLLDVPTGSFAELKGNSYRAKQEDPVETKNYFGFRISDFEIVC